MNNLGGGGVPGLEEMWDRMLSSGKMLYGIAVDDAHYFKRPEDHDGAAARARDGSTCASPRLESRALVEALERGEFYSSTGVELQSVDGDRDRADASRSKTEPSSKYRIQFIGRQGRVLSEATTARRPTRSRATKATCARR